MSGRRVHNTEDREDDFGLNKGEDTGGVGMKIIQENNSYYNKEIK